MKCWTETITVGPELKMKDGTRKVGPELKRKPGTRKVGPELKLLDQNYYWSTRTRTVGPELKTVGSEQIVNPGKCFCNKCPDMGPSPDLLVPGTIST